MTVDKFNEFKTPTRPSLYILNTFNWEKRKPMVQGQQTSTVSQDSIYFQSFECLTTTYNKTLRLLNFFAAPISQIYYIHRIYQ